MNISMAGETIQYRLRKHYLLISLFLILFGAASLEILFFQCVYRFFAKIIIFQNKPQVYIFQIWQNIEVQEALHLPCSR